MYTLSEKKKRVLTILFFFFFIFCLVVFFLTQHLSHILTEKYQREISHEVRDRTGALLEIVPNEKGHYMTHGPGGARVRALVIAKEDRFFYYHLGVNPLSIARSLFARLVRGEQVGGSTITQQLVKNLLGHENERTIKNKLTELMYAIALELHTSKDEILTMYLSSAYFGRQIAGIEGAAQYYYGKTSDELTDGDIVRLLALLSAPSIELGSAGNTLRATHLGERLGVYAITPYKPLPPDIRDTKRDPAMFELSPLITPDSCTPICKLTIDRSLTAKIREIIHDRLLSKQFASVHNAAVVVIALGHDGEPNTIRAIVGTPNPYGSQNGAQINMALTPRPIGSTAKPFIYSKGIENGLRPYSLIDDSEYRYNIGTGFAFYPKNYDGLYHGKVTLSYALANSLNVPAVRALEFVGVSSFGQFLTDELGFTPHQALDSYQLSIALGGLEMNPLLLANYFSIFPQNGLLLPLQLENSRVLDVPMSTDVFSPRRIFGATTTALMNAMLSDRLMGVEQFGLTSNLNLPFDNYAVKTGTSYDYHDSWTVGYTPDVVVVVWIGNSNNKAMDLVSGARGAGKIWNDVMSLLFARGDITARTFSKRELVDVQTAEGLSFGLAHDDVTALRTVMSDRSFVLEPHDHDVILFQEKMTIPLRSTRRATWKLNGTYFGEGTELYWSPKNAGEYTLTAYENGGEAVATLHVRIIQE